MQKDSLIKAKLLSPLEIAEALPRPQLLARLEQGLAARLSLISAPAGSGKTTLLSEWARSSSLPFAWVTLDAQDNEPTRYITYLIAALQTIQPDVCRDVLASLGAPLAPTQAAMQRLGAAWQEAVLTGLVNELGLVTQKFVLILDDYHHLTSTRAHKITEFILDYMPQQMHMVIATRADPPLRLARLRVRRQLNELRMDDLRFTAEETAEFLSRVSGLWLSSEDIETLDARTEGWIAALQMAALSMQGRKDARSFIKAFSGSDRYVLDYLADEALNRQPEHIQEFLLKTAVLERLNSSLCDAVTGRTDSQMILDTLERANLFILPMDSGRYWFRYHHLFSDLLRDRLDTLHPLLAPELHRKACEWFTRNGRIYEAIGHALAAQDYQRAANLLENTDPTVVMRGEVKTLLGWFAALPADLLRARPRLLISQAWALFVSANVDAIEPLLLAIIQALGLPSLDEISAGGAPGSPLDAYLGEIAALRMLVTNYRGRSAEAIALAKQALERLPAENLIERSVVYNALGDAHQDMGNVNEAQKAYMAAIQASQSVGHTSATMAMTPDLARLLVVRGHLRQAADMFRQVLDWGSGRMRPLYAVAQAHIGLGDVLREWNRLEEAEHYLTEGVRQCERGEYTRYAVFGYVALARLRRRQGRREAVFENLEKAEQFARRAGIRKDMAFVAAHRARLCLTPEVNDMAAALAWAEQAGWNAPEQTDTNREVECFTLFRLHIVQTQRGEIPPAELEADLDTLAALLRAAESSDRTASILESLALQALMLHVLGRQVNAIKSLERALAIAEAQDYASVFVDEGKMMARLLIQVTNPLISTAYIGRLMAILQEKEVSGSPDRRALVAGLTEREYEVLRLIAAGLSNREISDRLVVTLTTVKAHARNIYSKLDVNSRSQAAALARKMNLI